MSEPVAFRLSNGQITVRGQAVVPIGALLYLHPDPRVAELEAVLREAREALVPYMKYVDGTKILNHPAQVVAKIDEVLNGRSSDRT